MESGFVESVASSLIREYLSRKGLRQTLISMELEAPRHSPSINNRMDLMKTLHIEKLIKKNKDLEQPHRSMVEVITRHFLEKAESKLATNQDFYSEYSSGNKVHPQFDSSSLGRPRSGPRRLRNGSNASSSSDLVVEDDLDPSETVLGTGKAGIMSRLHNQEDNASARSSPRSKQRSAHMRSTTSPISTKLEDHLSANRSVKMKRGPPPVHLDENSNSSSPPTNHKPMVGPPVETLQTGVELEDECNDLELTPESSQSLPASSPVDNQGSVNEKEVTEKEEIIAPTQNEISSSPKLQKEPMLIKRPLNDLKTRPGSASGSPVKGQGQSSKSRSPKSYTRESDIGDIPRASDMGKRVKPMEFNVPPRLAMRQTSCMVDSKPIDMQTAIDLKTVIFGTACQNFSDPWRYQSFTFNDLPKLQYGLVQKKAGPCGVLAAVQAIVIQHLVYGEGPKVRSMSLEPTRVHRSEALAESLAAIFWRAGSRKRAVVALPSMRAHFQASPKYKTDILTETLILSTFTRQDELSNFLKQNITQFELDGTSGVVLALYSAILSRTITGVRSDMDDHMGKLLNQEDFCSQGVVNLLLCGSAVSNVFNDVLDVDKGDHRITVLKGVPCRCDVGLLSLNKLYTKAYKIGSYLKTPRTPIWLVWMDNHYSITFSFKRDLISDWKAERRFDLIYYDCLLKQDKEIRLTLDNSNRHFKPPTDEDVPPLDTCLRTKWMDADIDWNGTEPLL